MRVVLKMLEGDQVVLRATTSMAEAECDCPQCGEPLWVRGDGRSVSPCDRYYLARGFCVACVAHVGEIRAYPATLFGIEEDERALNGRARAY